MEGNQTLDLSWNTIWKIIFLFFAFYLIFLVREILILVFFAIVLSILFEPAIRFLERFRIKRILATLFVYLLFFLFLSTILYFSFRIFLREGKKFLEIFPQFFEKFHSPLRELGLKGFEDFQSFINFIQEWLLKSSGNIFSAIFSLFGGIFTTLTIFILAIFLSFEEGAIERFIYLISPSQYQDLLPNLWEGAQKKVMSWFGIRILACFFVGFLVYLTCHFLNIDYGILFAFLTGALDLIPFIGPLIAGILLFLFVLINSWWPKAFLVLVLFIIIQQLEGNVFVPILTKRIISISPFVILFSLLVGGKLFGLLGAIFAIPFLAIIFDFGKEFLKARKSEGSYE